jgi:hypothetical protein
MKLADNRWAVVSSPTPVADRDLGDHRQGRRLAAPKEKHRHFSRCLENDRGLKPLLVAV